MDVNKLLKTVHNLNDYISATQEVINKHSNSKIQFNMSTVLSLKKIRSLEIEYFNKCDESGAGVKILELMLRLPPSKTWSLLGKELVLLMQYWLEAIRKHLIRHNNNWWNFLSTILKFIQAICLKHTVLANILVQDLSECLLDLATNPQPTVIQRIKLLQCYNSVCAESSREIRYALRNKFASYFVKLSSILPSCGDIRAQYNIMETLLRWLLPRQDVTVKREATYKWFPQSVYSEVARRIFIERNWQNFFKDAREFLNAHNMNSDLITTVTCRRFCIGNITLISGTDRDYYLDLNTGTKSMSVMMEPSLEEVLGAGSDAVLISKDNTDAIRLYRESLQVCISINITDPRLLHPSPVLTHRDILLVVSSRSDLVKLNNALRLIFDTKYELLMDLEHLPPTSPVREVRPRSDNISTGARSFRRLEPSTRKRSGYMVRPKLPVSGSSPSTASTSSLALLREKLTAFPGCKLDKEPVSVCALPQLSRVTEVTEDERQSLNASLSTYKLRTYGVCTSKRLNKSNQSDEGENKSKTPINFDESSISCLLVATIGSKDSVINDTLERLPKDKELHTDNIVELLAREALNSSASKLDSKNVSKEKTRSDANSSIIEDAPQGTAFNNEKTFVSNSATDVSSADVVEGTQFVNDSRGIKTISFPLEEKPIENKQTTYDIQAVEDFFSQHCNKNRNGDLLISPSLAKKINETSSESSLDFDIRTPIIVDIGTHEYDVNFNFDNTEIVECLNDMVDKVGENLEKYTEQLTKEIKHLNVCDIVQETLPKTSLNNMQELEKNTNKKLKNNTQLKQQSKNAKTIKNRGKKQNKLTENIKRMSTIVEKDSDVEKNLFKNTSPESLNDYETPLIRRKRKLYSPKDDNAVNEKTGIHISETEDDYSVLTGPIKVDKTHKTLATSYKDIEKIRRTSAFNLRNRKSVINMSPRSKENNDIFDNLKKSVEGEEKIILAEKINKRSKKLAIYNFSSDSEDDDFQNKELSIKCTNTVRNVDSARSTRARKLKGRNVNSKEKNKGKKNKQVKRRKSKSEMNQKISDPRNEMIDERIREAATEALNTSLVVDQQHDLIPSLEPILHEKPQMEIIEDERDLPTRRSARRKKPTNLSLKKEKVLDKDVCSDKEQSIISSPLPELIIETVQIQIHKDPDDSVNAMLEKYKGIYKNEPLPDISEINTTHNLLSDFDNNTYDSKLNVTEEFNIKNRNIALGKRLGDEEIINSPKAKNSKLITSNNSEENEPQIITLSDELDVKSDKSIATLGKSPITGHGDYEESPPNTEHLKEHYEPRGLETQDLNESMKDYFNKLTKDIYEGSQSSKSEIILNKTTRTKEIQKSPIKLINKGTTSNQSPTVSITRLSPKEIVRWLPNRFNSIFGSNQSSETDRPVRITRSHTKSQDLLRKNDSNTTTEMSSKTNFRKSTISPIKMFGEVNKEMSVTSENNDYIKHIKNMMTTKRENIKTDNTKLSKYDLRKRCSRTEKSCKTASSGNSTDVGYSKRRSSPAFEVAKKLETGTTISDFESGHASSVSEWFNRNELQKQNRAESVDLPLKDSLENIMEKLETTLTEIHHKTSNKFVSMFVDAQKHLTDLKEKRRQLYRQTALEVISDIVKVIDVKFGELERRSQDLDQQFLEGVKDGASDVMRADCQQKRLMVSLLKEDVQNVLNHINKGTL